MADKARTLFNDHNISKKLKIVQLFHRLFGTDRVFDGH